ncbi:hypothetical protein [Catellatospora methionotrophica]|uniref:hypothetical protein n=1 Tax=Catellatospora methionotrophica TaxID=121620 RepID=UPI003411E26D
MAVIGTLIAESLAADAVLDVPLTLRRLQRIVIADPAAGQPSHWTLIDFTCAEDDVDRFADQLAVGLAPGPWYADFGVPGRRHVVFAGRRFVINNGDRDQREQVVAYAQSVGVPSAQLDWPQ